MNAVVVKAHGKINLTLDVLRRRQDGYHEIISVMQSINASDTIIVSKATKGIKLTTNKPIIRTNNNLAFKAAELFFTKTGIEAGVTINLTKNLPVAAGLAGGSADAAAVLWSLNMLYQTNIPIKQLQIYGQRLGADIPFCLQGGIKLAQGIGEKLKVLPPIPEYRIVLVKPQKSVSTKQVYQAVTQDLFGDHYSSDFVNALTQSQDIVPYVGNVLEKVTNTFIPEINAWKIRLADSGAKVSLMSGSGPTVLGIFTDEDAAQRFLAKWRHLCWMTVTKPCPTGITVVEK